MCYQGKSQMSVDGVTNGDASEIIDVFVQDEQSGDVYDLSGKMVTAPSHGVYIKNGKKIIY